MTAPSIMLWVELFDGIFVVDWRVVASLQAIQAATQEEEAASKA
jgi:hypothetical protein